ncbi:MAG: hypothetical protein ACRC62_05430, partial [Microcoleus sp.]
PSLPLPPLPLPSPSGAVISTGRSENFNEFDVLFLNVKSYDKISQDISGDDRDFFAIRATLHGDSKSSVDRQRR